MKISIMITTKNRLEDLSRTCSVIKCLDPQPFEVLLTADGCTDDTIKFVQQQYSQFKLIINEKGQGSVASRARMMQIAQGDLVLSLDDDSYPEQHDCLKTLIALFENNEELAIATFPQRTDEYPETLTQTDFGSARPVRSFVNSGACLRVSTYRSLPGFEPMFFHMYEEPDYALQSVASGWQIYYFPEITIRHHYSSRMRNEMRTHQLHARNEFWSTIMRCPFPQLIGIAFYRVYSQASFITRKEGIQGLVQEPAWWAQAIRGLPQCLQKRQPLTWAGYMNWIKLS